MQPVSRFIRKNLSCGIFTVYGKKNNPVVYLSTGICEAAPLTDSFSPFGDSVIAEFENGILKSFNTSLAEKLKSKKHSDNFFVSKPVIKNDVLLRPNIELASYSLVVEFAKIGFGIGYATKEYINNYLDNKELFILNIKEKIPSRYVGIALSKNNIPNFSTKKLIEIITKKAGL